MNIAQRFRSTFLLPSNSIPSQYRTYTYRGFPGQTAGSSRNITYEYGYYCPDLCLHFPSEEWIAKKPADTQIRKCSRKSRKRVARHTAMCRADEQRQAVDQTHPTTSNHYNGRAALPCVLIGARNAQFYFRQGRSAHRFVSSLRSHHSILCDGGPDGN